MNYRFLKFPGFKTKALTLSYDDGVRFDKRLTEILDAYGLKCTFNINSELFAEKEGEWRLTEKAAKALYSGGAHEVAVHGAKHLSLTEVSDAAALREILTDKENLEKLFGVIITGMAYANGSCDERTATLCAQCGIKYARTTVSTGKFDIPQNWLLMPATCHHNDPRLGELTDKFLSDGRHPYFWANPPKLFYLWGHSYEYNDNDNWSVIEAFAKKTGRRDDIYYATNGELYSYVKAFDSLITSADGMLVHNPTCTDVYMDYYDKDVLIGAGKTVSLR